MNSPQTIQDCFEKNRIFLVGGPGGVGKTTLAASLGIALSERGYKTVVLTVDPARRLAQALGFDSFAEEIQRVPLPQGELYASMLDARRYFDRIIERFATSDGQRQKILGNPMYQVMVESLGGSHEYAAMERLLEFASDSKWQKIIVDTPPTDNARDLFAAPGRLADFMDNSVLRWFQGGGAFYMRLFRSGTRLALRALQTLFGAEFLDSLGRFLEDLEGMQAGFQSRHREVLALLRSPSSSFFLTTFPSEGRWEDSLRLMEVLKGEGIPLEGVFLNQVEPTPGPRPVSLNSGSEPFQRDLARWWDLAAAEIEAQRPWRERLASLKPTFTKSIDRRSSPIHDVASLSEIGNQLLS